MIKRFIRAIILFYKNNISTLFISSCKYYPTCSTYALEAIEEYGVIRGLLLSVLRIIRCNPFARGKYDPVIKRK